MPENAPRYRQAATCPYCGLHDHTGREHFQFVASLLDRFDADVAALRADVEALPEPTVNGGGGA